MEAWAALAQAPTPHPQEDRITVSKARNTEEQAVADVQAAGEKNRRSLHGLQGHLGPFDRKEPPETPGNHFLVGEI